MTKMIWTNPQTKTEIEVIVVETYDSYEPMLRVHKATATSSKFVFGVRASDCREVRQ